MEIEEQAFSYVHASALEQMHVNGGEQAPLTITSSSAQL